MIESNIIISKDITYPILKQYKNEFVVLFSSPKTGMIVHVFKNSTYFLGQYSETWEEDNFISYNNKISLKNI